jgi:hypothetical protein
VAVADGQPEEWGGRAAAGDGGEAQSAAVAWPERPEPSQPKAEEVQQTARVVVAAWAAQTVEGAQILGAQDIPWAVHPDPGTAALRRPAGIQEVAWAVAGTTWALGGLEEKGRQAGAGRRSMAASWTFAAACESGSGECATRASGTIIRRAGGEGRPATHTIIHDLNTFTRSAKNRST